MKIKINKNKYPYFAAAILVLAAFFVSVWNFSKDAQPTFSAATGLPNGPKVLGATVESLRGSEIGPSTTSPRKTSLGELDFNKVSAKSFSIIDESTGAVLFEKQPHLKLPIASLTKLMTVLLAYERLNPDEAMEILPADELNVEPSLNLKAGTEVKILDLMEATLVCSANDAARALANEVQRQYGNKQTFVSLMNEKAQSLGLLETNFSNPLGFDSDYNFSTVADLEKLAFYTQGYGLFKSMGRKTEVSFLSADNRAFSCKATNKLVGKNLEIEAIKTGYTQKALGSIIARVTRDGKKLIVLLVGSEDREGDLLKLSEIAFENFVWE